MSPLIYRAAVRVESLVYGLILLVAATDDREPSDHDLLAGPLQVAFDPPALNDATWPEAS